MTEIAVNIVINELLSLLNQEARLLGHVHTQVEDIKIELLYISKLSQRMQMQRGRKKMLAKALKLGFKA